MFLPRSLIRKCQYCGSLRDREVAGSESDRQGSIFELCVSSHSSHHPQEVLLAQFSLYVHEGGLKPNSIHFISFASLFASIFCHLKLELLTQFPASNDKKYLCVWKIDISNIEQLDKLSINQKIFYQIWWYLYWAKHAQPFKPPRCIKASFPENILNFPTIKVFKTKISMKLAYNYMAFFFNF